MDSSPGVFSSHDGDAAGAIPASAHLAREFRLVGLDGAGLESGVVAIGQFVVAKGRTRQDGGAHTFQGTVVGRSLREEGPRDAAAEGPLAERVADAAARVGVDVEGEPGRVGGGTADAVGSRVQCPRGAGTGQGAGCGGGYGAVLLAKGKNGTRGGELWIIGGGFGRGVREKMGSRRGLTTVL